MIQNLSIFYNLMGYLSNDRIYNFICNLLFIFSYYKRKKLLIVFVSIFNFLDLSANPLHSFGFIGIQNQFQKESSKTINLKTVEYIPETEGIFFYSPSTQKLTTDPSSDKINYDLKLYVRKKMKSNEGVSFYMGDNMYYGYHFKYFTLYVGRKLFNNLYRVDPNWKDGVEGVSLETKFKNGGILNLYLLDIYRGYPLFQNEFFLESSSRSLEKGNRQRYALEYSYPSSIFSFQLHSQFFQLGNWGKLATEDPLKPYTGDGDFLYSHSVTLGVKKNLFFSQFSFLSTRGVDRTPYNRERKSKNLALSGEAIHLSIGLDSQSWKLGGFIFLPDSDKRNARGEILDYGYIGTGAFLTEGFLLSQSIHYIPSNWITGKGLEKNDSFDSSRQNSFYGKGKFSFFYQNLKFHLLAEHLIPYRKDVALTGQVYFDKKFFSKDSLTEISLILEMGELQKSSPFFRFQISSLTSTDSIGYKGTSVLLMGGITL
jgi:hypothetical protein